MVMMGMVINKNDHDNGNSDDEDNDDNDDTAHNAGILKRICISWFLITIFSVDYF